MIVDSSIYKFEIVYLMHGINNSNASRANYAPPHEPQNEENHEELSPGKSGNACTITHRICHLAEDVAGTGSVQAAMTLSELPSVQLTKNFYQPQDEEPLLFDDKHLMTHRDFRAMLSQNMHVYAIITDGANGNGARNIMVIGKPNFNVNDLTGNFFTSAFKTFSSLKETPFSSDLIGLSLDSPHWIVHDFYEKLETKAKNNEEMSSTEQSIYNKLHPNYGQCETVNPPSKTDYLNDISPMESIFIFSDRFNASFKELKEMQVNYYHENRLNPKATIDDLPEILHHYKDIDHEGANGNWMLNYLDKALLSNAKWE